MNTAEIEQEISRIQAEIDGQRKDLDAEYIKFLPVAIQYVKQWMGDEFIGFLKQNADLAQNIPDTQREIFKASLKKTQESTDEFLRVEFNDKSLWPHYNENTETTLTYDSIPDHLSKNIRLAMSNLGNLMADLAHNMNRYPDSGKWGYGDLRFSYRGEIPGSFKFSTHLYNKQFNGYIRSIIELKRLKKALEESKIDDLWKGES